MKFLFVLSDMTTNDAGNPNILSVNTKHRLIMPDSSRLHLKLSAMYKSITYQLFSVRCY